MLSNWVKKGERGQKMPEAKGLKEIKNEVEISRRI